MVRNRQKSIPHRQGRQLYLFRGKGQKVGMGWCWVDPHMGWYVDPRIQDTDVIEVFMVILLSLAPCPPQNVTVEPSCEENGVTVSWVQSHVAISYELVATASDGHSTSCNTTVNNCTLSDLHCGQMYLLSIVARGENCTSEPSTLFFQAGRHDKAFLVYFSSFHQDYPLGINAALHTWA